MFVLTHLMVRLSNVCVRPSSLIRFEANLNDERNRFAMRVSFVALMCVTPVVKTSKIISLFWRRIVVQFVYCNIPFSVIVTI